MTEATDFSSAHQPYHDLLEYFNSRQDASAETIPHPDTGINAMAQEKLDQFRKAAVLIPVTRLRDRESHVVLTVRSANLKSHAGQISLPGGTSEPEDQDEAATALRESEEEIGLQSHHVEIVGRLGELALPSGFRVTPVIGVIENDLEFTACPIEVADIFQAPLELILNPDAYMQSSYEYQNQQRKVLELHYEDYRIWGATAAILHHLAVQVRKTRN